MTQCPKCKEPIYYKDQLKAYLKPQGLVCKHCGTKLDSHPKLRWLIYPYILTIFIPMRSDVRWGLAFMFFGLFLWLDTRLGFHVSTKVRPHDESDHRFSLKKLEAVRFYLGFLTLPILLITILGPLFAVQLDIIYHVPYAPTLIVFFHYLGFIINQVFLILLFNPRFLSKVLTHLDHWKGYIVAWLIFSFLPLMMIDIVLLDYIKPIAKILFALSTLGAFIPWLIQFRLNRNHLKSIL